MELIKKIKQNGILFVGIGIALSDLDEFIELTEQIKNALETVGLIFMALPFPFYLYDWIKALKKKK